MGRINWQKTISRRETPIRSELIGRGSAKYVIQLLGTPNDNFLFLYDHGQGSVYFDPTQVQAMGIRVAQQIKNDPDFLKKHTEILLRRCNDMVVTSQKIGSQDLKTLTTPQLGNLFEQFVDTHLSFSPYMMIAVAVERVVTQIIKEKLLKNSLISGDVSTLDSYVAKLLQTDKMPEVLKEQADFTKLQRKIHENKQNNLQKLLTEHWQKYRWLSVYSPNDEPYSLEYFKDKLKNSDIPTTQASKSTNNSFEFEETLAQLSLEKETVSFIRFLREYIYLRTFRVEQLCKAYFYIQPLFAEIARRAGLSLYEFCLCSLDETRSFLDGHSHIDKADVEHRKTKFVYVIKNGVFTCYSGQKADEIFTSEVRPEKMNDTNAAIAGSVASKGIGIGKVHIVLDKQDMANFKKGEVLVTIMTNPDYTILMHKACAIITDEGGVTCHAAIVSRELGIPCIVGTKNATQILHNGDLVKVDAVNNIIAKII